MLSQKGKRSVDALTAIEVARLKKPGAHVVGTVAGLRLRVRPNGSRYWVLRIVVGKHRRDIGIGAYPQITLAKAWEEARNLHDAVRKGQDPIDQRRAKKSERLADQVKAVTFKDAADTYITTHESGWRNAKHAQQWRNTLEAYAYPVIGSLFVRDVAQAHILKILEPIWTIKTETATRVRGRIEKILDWAKGRGYRTGDNPAAWKGNLEAQLPHSEKVAKVEHHTALPMNSIGAFMAELRAAEGTGARALEFSILTASRSGEVRGATWPEIDLAEKVWTIPAARMKAGKEHRVPLSPAAVKLLESLTRMAGTDSVFPAPRGGVLSDMTLTAVIRRMNKGDEPRWIDPKDGSAITVHGFRSTFRDWAGEASNFPREVIEHALAHQLRDKAEAAYARGTLFDKRRHLMNDWARFCARTAPATGTVVPMPKRA